IESINFTMGGFHYEEIKKVIAFILTTALSASMTANVFAAEIPRESSPIDATEKQIVIVENIIGDILDEVEAGNVGYGMAASEASARIRKAGTAGETNGHGYGILSGIMRNAIRSVRDMYLKLDVYQEAEEWLKVLLADTITGVENGMDINIAISTSVSSTVTVLRAITDKCCDWMPENDAITNSSTRAYHDGRHIHLIYADYFLTEAILRLIGEGFLIW
ncbi:MAG: hypothetical protein ACI38A_11315, partial [Candidatus Ornithomonoglobus sp.]